MKKIILITAIFLSLFLASSVDAVFNKTLYRGSTGSEVAELQKALAALPSIYPEQMITGFFGSKTEQAVKRFQKQYGMEQVGVVGPKTRAKLNALSASPSIPFSSQKSPVGSSQPAFVPPPPAQGGQATPYSSGISPAPLNTLSQLWGGGKCEGKGAVTLTSPPMKMDEVAFILPMGLMSGSHVTPVDHLYFHASHIKTGRYDVLAPANGFVVSAEIVGDSKDYRLVLEHSCTFYTIYIHITELAPKITAATGTFSQGSKAIRVPVRAGEIIGTKIPDVSKKTFQVDFSVANADVTLKGFIVPAHYAGEPWKIHTDDLYAYYQDPLRSALIAKTVRTAVPISGKIDYDIDGRVVGNWFRAGTNGYSGSNPSQYWEGHLTIAYDYLDPNAIRISMGSWGGKSTQAAVKGNAPNPKDVSVGTGLVKYELVDSHYTQPNGQPWDQETFAKDVRLDTTQSYEYGILLVQLIDSRKLKVETFLDKSASQISGFTPAAVMYER